MGKQVAGILGRYTGKVGNVVGSKWKNVDTVRVYSVPANPRTVAQVAHRGKFTLCQRVAQSILQSVVKPFWDGVSPGASGFNVFIGTNIRLVTDVNSFDDIRITSGSWEPVAALTSATYDSATGVVDISIDDSTTSVGTPFDRLVLVAIDATNWEPADGKYTLLAYVNTDRNRDEDGGTLALPLGLTPSNIHCYAGVLNPESATRDIMGNSLHSVASPA